jgi:RHS repeat-associated protein
VSPYSVNSSNELTSIPSATYTYDNNGNTLTKVTSAGTATYGWDYENRLSSITLPGTGGTLAFKYDALGHRVQKVFTQNSTSTTTNYLYDGSNAVTDVDQSGNVLARYILTQNIDQPLVELRSGTTSYYSQDGSGSVTSLTTSAAALGTTYDGNGIRVEKSSGTLYWRAITGDVLAETDTSGNTKNEYIYFAGQRVAWWDSLGNSYYIQSDALGTTRTITESNGTVCYDADFTPYGQELPHINNCPSTYNYKFTGYERDSETGLDYAFARYYSSRLGRFMSGDAMRGALGDPQSLNLYGYVANDPMNLIDPTGLKLKVPCLSEGTCDWDGSGSGSCTLDGASAACGSLTIGLWDGSIAPCPQNDCTQLQVGQNGEWQMYVVGIPPGVDPYPTQCQLTGGICGDAFPPGYWVNVDFQYVPTVQYTGWSTFTLQTKVFFQALGRNFKDEFKDGGCVAVFLGSVAGDAKNGGSPVGPQAEEVATQYGQGAAYTYAAAKGLSVPLRSSVYRDILGATEDISGVIGVGALDLDLFNAYLDELDALGSGECK